MVNGPVVDEALPVLVATEYHGIALGDIRHCAMVPIAMHKIGTAKNAHRPRVIITPKADEVDALGHVVKHVLSLFGRECEHNISFLNFVKLLDAVIMGV